MSVQFDEKPILASRPRTIRRSFISGLIIKTGIAKTEEGAKIVEVVLLVLVLMVMFFLVRANTAATPEPPTAEEIIP